MQDFFTSHNINYRNQKNYIIVYFILWILVSDLNM